MTGNQKDQEWLRMLSIITESLCLAIKGGTEDQHSLNFYWKIVSGISQKVKITPESSIKTIYQYHDVLYRLGPVYCKARKIDSTKGDAPNIQEIETFLSMSNALIKVLKNVQGHIDGGNVNYDQLKDYFDNYGTILEIADVFGVKTTVMEKSVVEYKLNNFMQSRKDLSMLLIQSLKNNTNW